MSEVPRRVGKKVPAKKLVKRKSADGWGHPFHNPPTGPEKPVLERQQKDIINEVRNKKVKKRTKRYWALVDALVKEIKQLVGQSSNHMTTFINEVLVPSLNATNPEMPVVDVREIFNEIIILSESLARPNANNPPHLQFSPHPHELAMRLRLNALIIKVLGGNAAKVQRLFPNLTLTNNKIKEIKEYLKRHNNDLSYRTDIPVNAGGRKPKYTPGSVENAWKEKSRPIKGQRGTDAKGNQLYSLVDFEDTIAREIQKKFPNLSLRQIKNYRPNCVKRNAYGGNNCPYCIALDEGLDQLNNELYLPYTLTSQNVLDFFPNRAALLGVQRYAGEIHCLKRKYNSDFTTKSSLYYPLTQQEIDDHFGPLLDIVLTCARHHSKHKNYEDYQRKLVQSLDEETIIVIPDAMSPVELNMAPRVPKQTLAFLKAQSVTSHNTYKFLFC